MRKSAWTIILSCLSLWASAQAEFIAQVDTQQIKLGEPIILELKAKLAEDQQFSWPLIEDLPGITIIEQGKLDTTKVDGFWQLKQELKITSFDSGAAYIPSFKLMLEDSNTVQTDSLALLVYFPDIKEEQDYYDIKGPDSLPFDYWLVLYWSLALILLAAVLWYAWTQFKKRKTNAPSPKLEPQIPADQWALEALANLESKGLWQAGENKAYYSELVDILRVFLEKQHGLKTMELTADELILKIKPLVKEDALYRQMKESLSLSALVKFAKQKPLPEENVQALAGIREFVKSHQIQKTEGDV